MPAIVRLVSAAATGGVPVMDVVSATARGFSGAMGSGSGIVGTTSAVGQVLASLWCSLPTFRCVAMWSSLATSCFGQRKLCFTSCRLKGETKEAFVLQ